MRGQKNQLEKIAYFVSDESAAKRLAKSLNIVYDFEDSQVLQVRGHICNCTNIAIESTDYLAWIAVNSHQNKEYIFYIAD